MRWLVENTDGLSENAGLCLSTIDTWLIHKLVGQAGHCLTDSTNASRTMLMDIGTLEWSETMLKEYEISVGWLPTIVKKSSDDYGKVGDAELPMLKDVPIGGVLGDQQAACLGHVLREGQVKNTYGTGCFLL